MFKNYSDLRVLPTFKQRFEYLKLNGHVAEETFGFDRYINQLFYSSDDWKRVRDLVIMRDLGCDLGVEGFEIFGRVMVHHMNPITVDDITNRKEIILDPEFLVCVSHETHNALHYGNINMLCLDVIERTPNDTCPWKH